MTLTVVLVILVLSSIVRSEDFRTEYLEALAKYGGGLMSRSKAEEKRHYKSFVEFSKMVTTNNDNPDSTYTAEINMFSIETEDERRKHLGRNSSNLQLIEREEIHLSKEDLLELIARADDSVDYSPFLPAIKNQGSCGSCWTFGAITPLEYQVSRRTGSVVSFSEQVLLDCVYEKANGKGNGCNGGYQDAVYKWLANNDNYLALNKDHPYKNKDLKCSYKSFPNGFAGWQVNAAVVKYPGDQKMLIAMSKKEIGVLTVAVHVNNAFSSYSNGVFSDSACQKVDNHAVSATGYGIRDGIPYFRIRNSWGARWGEGGYINIKRSQTENLNMCRVSEFAEFPVVTKKSDDGDDGGSDCTWSKVERKMLKGWLGQLNKDLSEAKVACEGDSKCVGVTCKNVDKKCGPRSHSTGWKHKMYTSYVRSCPKTRL